MNKRKIVIISHWQPLLDQMKDIMSDCLELSSEAQLESAKYKVFGNGVVPFTFHLNQDQPEVGSVLEVGGISDYVYFQDPVDQGQDIVEFIDPPGFERLLPGVYEVRSRPI
jgi:hypothetical protein